MPSCRKCGAEVDLDQKTCAWCGLENPAGKPDTPQKGLTSTPSSATHQAVDTQSDQLELARQAAQAGNIEEARKLFDHLLLADPQNEQALYGIGGLHFKQENHKKALEYWLRLKVINPKFARIDDWIEQARIKADLSKSNTPPPPKAPTRPAPVPPPPDKPSEDWQQGAVRVDPKALPKSPRTETKKKAPQVDAPPKDLKAVGKPKALNNMNSAPAWVQPLAWLFLLGYVVSVLWIYGK